MNIPPLTGLIDRRILLNYRADPAVVRLLLPPPFRPQLVAGQAMVGICLIRLRNVRPQGFAAAFGRASENGAHRIAVEWEANGTLQSGVYIPRRDTSSRLNYLVGNRLLGQHYHSTFEVKEQAGAYAVAFRGPDGTRVAVEAHETLSWPVGSIFSSLVQASDFYRQGAVGYSPRPSGAGCDGVELRTSQWHVSPLSVQTVTSSYFADEALFPSGSVVFDNALLMKNIPHQWQRVAAL
jgi:hypothetical protein